MPTTARRPEPGVRPDQTLLDRPPWAASATAVGLIAILAFGFRLGDEPPFVDESAYYSQSYFAGLYVKGDWNDPAWLSYPGYDLPPLPKYLIGGALTLGGYETPGLAQSYRWYRDTSTRFDPPGGLTVARCPSVVAGAVGCVAVYGLGTLAFGRGAGLTASLLLMANPLYRMLSRRAMSDVPCEAFTLVSLALGLWAWERLAAGRWGGRAVFVGALSGVFAGLALSCKMSGALAGMVGVAWLALGAWVGMDRRRAVWVVSASAAWGGLASLAFLGLNPYLTAHPEDGSPVVIPEVARESVWGRARMMADLRVKVAADQKQMFPHNALWTPAEKIATAAVQGFGRFGPFGPSHSDSTVRFDPRQDWGAAVWLPLVIVGAGWALAVGRRQKHCGEVPTAWAVVVFFAVAAGVVTAYLPLAWDRYFLPLQAPAALLGSCVIAAAVARITGASGSRPGLE